jgi:hypothetical protein
MSDLWRRIKHFISRRIQWHHRTACPVTLWQWAEGDILWSDIDWRCHDADVSDQPHCWCGKLDRGEADACKRQWSARPLQGRVED